MEPSSSNVSGPAGCRWGRAHRRHRCAIGGLDGKSHVLTVQNGSPDMYLGLSMYTVAVVGFSLHFRQAVLRLAYTSSCRTGIKMWPMARPGSKQDLQKYRHPQADRSSFIRSDGSKMASGVLTTSVKATTSTTSTSSSESSTSMTSATTFFSSSDNSTSATSSDGVSSNVAATLSASGSTDVASSTTLSSSDVPTSSSAEGSAAESGSTAVASASATASSSALATDTTLKAAAIGIAVFVVLAIVAIAVGCYCCQPKKQAYGAANSCRCSASRDLFLTFPECLARTADSESDSGGMKYRKRKGKSASTGSGSSTDEKNLGVAAVRSRRVHRPGRAKAPQRGRSMV